MIAPVRPDGPARLVTDWAALAAGEGSGMLPPRLTVYRRAAPVAAFPPGRVALSIRETAEALGVSERTANDLMLRGGLPSARVGGRRLVPVAALERWLDERATERG